MVTDLNLNRKNVLKIVEKSFIFNLLYFELFYARKHFFVILIKMDMLQLQSSINSSSDDTMDKAKRVWNMLDELASSDPTAYK